MTRKILKKYFLVVIGIVICVSACKPPKMTNAPTIPNAYYKFNKPRNQVIPVLDSIISNSQFFFKQESEEPDHIILNLKSNVDTITFVLFLSGEDLHNAKVDDSSILFVMNINRYRNRKLDETPLYPKMDSLQKKAYLNKLDSFIITPLRQQISKM